jgi:murein DD-endopeptidase MepM/ murein hydrolase activator NlpD
MAVTIACFNSGVAVGWRLRENGPPLPAAATLSSKDALDIDLLPERPVQSNRPAGSAVAVESKPAVTASLDTRPADTALADPIEELRRRGLRLPVDEITVEFLKGGFSQPRDGARPHEAIDIPAPRHTPIHAVEGGTIVKLFLSRAGGHTIYQFDPTRRFAYYYAHIERYAEGLKEGQPVARGDVIAFVGTSGNAPPDAPHLHFSIFALTPQRLWWKGTAIDPYLVFRR